MSTHVGPSLFNCSLTKCLFVRTVRVLKTKLTVIELFFQDSSFKIKVNVDRKCAFLDQYLVVIDVLVCVSGNDVGDESARK